MASVLVGIRRMSAVIRSTLGSSAGAAGTLTALGALLRDVLTVSWAPSIAFPGFLTVGELCNLAFGALLVHFDEVEAAAVTRQVSPRSTLGSFGARCRLHVSGHRRPQEVSRIGQQGSRASEVGPRASYSSGNNVSEISQTELPGIKKAGSNQIPAAVFLPRLRRSLASWAL